MKQLKLIIAFCILQFASGFIGIQFTIAQDSYNMKLLYHWEDTTLVGSTTFDNVYNEIWGYVKDGREYAIIGSTAGTHIFDITDPNNTDTVAFIPGAAQGGQIIHRDYHDYAGYLYMVSDEGASTLQIADLSYLPDSVPLVYDSDILIKNSHNIFIDTATAKLYACAMDDGAGVFKAMGIFSLADPENPTILPALILQAGQGWHVHDAYVKNDTAYCSNGMAGLFIFDLTNPASPQLLGSLTTYPDQDYNHSGWLTGDGNYYVFTDEAPAMDVKIYDVSDKSNMIYFSQFNSGVDSLSMAHNVIVKDNYVYCSYYHDGLQIFDISDPANPVNVGFYDTDTVTPSVYTCVPPDYLCYKGAWGVYPYLPSGHILVSDMQSGLFVLKVTDVSGVDEDDLNNILKLFPNPFADKLYIEFNQTQNTSTVNLYLYNSLGELVFESKEIIVPGSSDLITLELYDLPAGLYIVRITDGIDNYSLKILKVTQ
ncbi:MAG: choice-of-anchor B family protein [Bacteroidetes bacterium]|nr:choice-of-anchor B family protein [Bacteroidota bacterium]